MTALKLGWDARGELSSSLLGRVHAGPVHVSQLQRDDKPDLAVRGGETGTQSSVRRSEEHERWRERPHHPGADHLASRLMEQDSAVVKTMKENLHCVGQLVLQRPLDRGLVDVEIGSV